MTGSLGLTGSFLGLGPTNAVPGSWVPSLKGTQTKRTQMGPSAAGRSIRPSHQASAATPEKPQPSTVDTPSPLVRRTHREVTSLEELRRLREAERRQLPLDPDDTPGPA